MHLYFEIPLTKKQTIYFRETLQEFFDCRACVNSPCRSLYNNISYLQTASVENECKNLDKILFTKTPLPIMQPIKATIQMLQTLEKRVL